MGCDIHLYIEYKRPQENKESYDSFGSSIYMGRNYHLFGLLARGVRYSSDKSFEPRGLPPIKELSIDVRERAFVHVVHEDDPFYDKDIMSASDDCITAEQALKFYQNKRDALVYSDSGKLVLAYAPYTHSHSWLTPDEFRKCCSNYLIECEDFSDELHADKPELQLEWSAVLNTLDFFIKKGCDARIVFWFDN